MRKLLPFVLLACLAAIPAAHTACASAPPTKVAQIADVAAKVELSAGALLKQAQQAQAAGLITRTQLDVVALAVDKIGRLGLDLQSGLSDYNAAKTAGADTTKQAAVVNKIVADITQALADVGKAIPNGTVAAIDQAAVQVLGLVVQIKGGL